MQIVFTISVAACLGVRLNGWMSGCMKEDGVLSSSLFVNPQMLEKSIIC